MDIVSGRAKTRVYAQVLAPLLILLVTLGSLAALAFLATQAFSCVRSFSALPGAGSQSAAHDIMPATLVVDIK